MKVYCGDCERYVQAGWWKDARCFHPHNTYYAPDEETEDFPQILNQDNDCKYFLKKSGK